MTKAELSRQGFSHRALMLEELKQFLRHEELEDVDPNKIPDAEYAPPDLLPFVKK
jgi:hypothetical protein